MQEDTSLPVPKGESSPDIAFSAEAFSRLIEVCRARMPAETVGALVGTSLVGEGRQRVTNLSSTGIYPGQFLVILSDGSAAP